MVAEVKLDELPDELIIHVLSMLDCKDRCAGLQGAGSIAFLLCCMAGSPPMQSRRLGTAALVCRRWRQLTLAPQLLQSFEITNPDVPLFGAFINKHTRGHLRRVQLQFDADVPGPQMYLLLMFCGFSGVTQLSLYMQHTLRIQRWVHRTRHLQSLELRGMPLVLHTVDLTVLASLRRLLLGGGPIANFAAVQLPPSLESLELHGVLDGALPEQVGACARGGGWAGQCRMRQRDSRSGAHAQITALTQLTRLDIVGVTNHRVPSNGYTALEPLAPTLRHLALTNCHLPDTLSTLSTLDKLALTLLPGEKRMLNAALRHLGQLQELVVEAYGPPPPSLAALTQLHTLSWSPLGDDVGVLPPGQWLAGLRVLQAPAGVLFNSFGALQAAPNLQLVRAGMTNVVATCSLVELYADERRRWKLALYVKRRLLPAPLRACLDKAMKRWPGMSFKIRLYE